MHIGIVCEHSDPARGGAELYLHRLAARLREHGHEVTQQRHASDCDVVLATLPLPGCDFYQPHHGLYDVSIPAHYDPLPWGVRHLRRWNPVRKRHFARLRKLEERAIRGGRVLALSPRMVADVERLYSGAHTILRRPGVDLERFTPGEGGGGLLFVAHNFRLKGLHTLLRAMEQLPELRLTVVGPDRPVPADRVEYVTNPTDLPALYRQADLLVHPTFYDTASLVVMEALASGTPVISTVRDGNSDLAVRAGGAALKDPGDVDALVRAIRDVQVDRAKARAVAEEFPEDKMLDAVVETITCASSS